MRRHKPPSSSYHVNVDGVDDPPNDLGDAHADDLDDFNTFKNQLFKSRRLYSPFSLVRIRKAVKAFEAFESRGGQELPKRNLTDRVCCWVYSLTKGGTCRASNSKAILGLLESRPPVPQTPTQMGP